MSLKYIKNYKIFIIGFIFCCIFAGYFFSGEKYVFEMNIGSKGSGLGQLLSPKGVVVDSKGNIYVLDQGNSRIQQFNNNGVYLSHFNSKQGDNGEFDQYYAIAIDKNDNIFLTLGYKTTEEYSTTYLKFTEYKIAKFNRMDVNPRQFGTNHGYEGLYRPYGIAINENGDIYVTAASQWIQKFNTKGEYQLHFGGWGKENGYFREPCQLAVDSNENIWIADDTNNKIQKFNSNGEYQSKIWGIGSGNGQFDQPCGVAIDSKQNIFVADTGNNRIQEFNSNGVYISQFGSYGTDNGQFHFPLTLTFDKNDNIFVVDLGNNRIQKFTKKNVLIIKIMELFKKFKL